MGLNKADYLAIPRGPHRICIIHVKYQRMKSYLMNWDLKKTKQNISVSRWC